MKVCIIGNGLVSLILAKVLSKKALSVDIFSDPMFHKYSPTRTVGITKSNLDYLNQNVLNLEKISWGIKQIKIFTENFKKEEILNFSYSDKKNFFIVKNEEFFSLLKKKLKNNRLIKFKKNKGYQEILKENYDLIINCDPNHQITKKFFSNRFIKKYNSSAFTAIITHKRLKKNDVAFQIFTHRGPIAFLPVSRDRTSIVYSFKTKLKDTSDVTKLIYKFNPIFEIKKISNLSKFELKSLNLRNYYKDNILAFGDLLHKLHPLAGQGFNMSIRDIKEFLKIIDCKIKLGLPIDQSVCIEFQNNVKSKNFVFSEGINFIYEYFNSENKIGDDLIDSTARLIGRNKILNKYFKNIADMGLQN